MLLVSVILGSIIWWYLIKKVSRYFTILATPYGWFFSWVIVVMLVSEVLGM